MNPLYYAFGWFSHLPILGNLPFLPWWGWLIVLALIWTGLIMFVSMPWWGWVLLSGFTVAYLFISLIVAVLQAT